MGSSLHILPIAPKQSSRPPMASRGPIPSIDGAMASLMCKEAAMIHEVALAHGQNVSHGRAAVYVNYALFHAPLEDIYGQNAPKLREIRAAIDPEDVMELTGGFKL